MFKSRHLQKRIVLIALFAVLFSALSPALAALRFQSQPQILAELCTMHGLKRVAIDATATDESPAQHSNHRHGIYCALCMPASAQQAITAPVIPEVALVEFKQVQPYSQEVIAAFAAPFVSYQSQAPPVFS